MALGRQVDLSLVDDAVWVLQAPTGISIYDFDFRAYFPCRGLRLGEKEVCAIGRIGAASDYQATYDSFLSEGIRLVHTPEEHLRCSELSGWYPLISNWTPCSKCYVTAPTAQEVERDFSWPVFVKGSRQTSRHKRSLSVIHSASQFEAVMAEYRHDPILHWQPVVVRELTPLRLVEEFAGDRIATSFEFRTFWWYGQCIGAGRYWWEGKPYDWSPREKDKALALGTQVAKQVNVPFLVVDLAMTNEGEWIVIECNDGQESGYAGVMPVGLWQRVIEAERKRLVAESQ